MKNMIPVPLLIKFISSLVLIIGMITLLNKPTKAALSSDYTIVCGQTINGQPIQCNLSTHRCYKCKEKRGWFAQKVVYYVFNCLSRDAPVPDNCERSNSGGTVGDADVKIFGLTYSRAHIEGTNCVTENLMAMYSSTCYSCEITEILVSAFVRASAKAYQVSREAGNAILVVGFVLWVCFFVLKNISSFTTVEPMKMIQDLLIQVFKVFLAFVIVNSGIPTILHYTMEPLMLAGTDFGTAILTANVGVNRSLTTENMQEIQEENTQNAGEKQ